MTTQSDYIRSDELQEAIVPVADLPDLFHVDMRTIRRWIDADELRTFPHPMHPEGTEGRPPLVVRWGDVQIGQHHRRWRRKE